MTRLLLARHGRTDWNDEGRYQGQSDPSLNAEGWRQAEELAARLRDEPLAAVFSSDLRRAEETARAVAELHRLVVRIDPRLREIHQGRWDGMLYDEILAQDGDLLRAWEAHPLAARPPGGESLDEVRSRVVAATRDIVGEFPRQVVCLVSHKVSLTVLRCVVTGEDLERALQVLPSNATYVTLDAPDDPSWLEERASP
ncbi:MAG: histidine phosphatase family protein [Chloroflexi bacterium]|nr:histidine phosphatase family protein [Chloroflexota bacterium]